MAHSDAARSRMAREDARRANVASSAHRHRPSPRACTSSSKSAPALAPSSGAPITGARTLGSAALARRRARKQQRAPRAARTHSGSATPSTHISAGGQRCHGGMSAGLSSMRKRPRPYAHAASGAGCVQMLAHMSTWGRAVWFQLPGQGFWAADWSTDRARSGLSGAHGHGVKCRCGGSTEGEAESKAKDGERTSAAPTDCSVNGAAASEASAPRRRVPCRRFLVQPWER